MCVYILNGRNKTQRGGSSIFEVFPPVKIDKPSDGIEITILIRNRLLSTSHL